MLLPWRQPAVAVALVGAFALPALLLTSGPMFRTAASDEITVGVIDTLSPTSGGLIVLGEGPFDDERLGALTGEIDARLRDIDGLGEPSLTLFSNEVGPTAVDAAPVDRRPGPGEIRVMSRPGAVEAVEILEGGPDGGVLVPRSLASEYELVPGSVVTLGAGDVTVAGVYRDVWDGELDPFWSSLPRDMVPRFQRVFDEPSFEMVITDEATARRLGLRGRARWEAELAEPPATWVGFRRLAAEYGRFESALARPGPLATAHSVWATDPNLSPILVTAVPDAERTAAGVIAELEQPIRTATWSGTVIGLLLSTLGAIFLIRRRRSDHRLMAADGDAAWRFFARAVMQYTAPAATASVVGVVVGWALIRLLGPSGTATWSVVPWSGVVLVSVGAVLLAGVTSAVISVRLVDSMNQPVGAVGRTWLFVLAGVAVTMWIQVGRERGDDVNPLIVSFPFVGVVTGVLVAVGALRLVLRRLRRTGRQLPTSLFLAWRALTASEAGALTLTAALGLASGLVVLSVSFVETIDAATTAKAATITGAVSRIDTIENVDPADLPPGSTVVLSFSTQIDDRTAEVLAIDPSTFADAVAWPPEFGRSPDEVVELLGTDVDGALPAVAVVGRGTPDRGEFGLQRVHPYELVGTIASAPMASPSGMTLLVRADVFEEFSRDRWDRGQLEIDPVDQQIADMFDRELEYTSPLDTFGDTVLSTLPLDELEVLAEERGWPVRETGSLAEQASDVDARATRWAFDYLGLLAVIAGVVAIAVMAFYLAERRRQREVTAVMTHQIGIRQRTNVAAAVIEIVGLVVAAVAAGAVAAAVTARRVFPVFEPDPGVPPTVALIIDETTVLAVLVGTIVVVAGVAAWSQRSVSHAEQARVLRG